MTIEYDDQLALIANAYDVQVFLDAWQSDPRTLELQPPFQRNMVWNDDQRSYLVDSILRGLPVPELYLQKTTSPDGAQQIVVVDGQQRISACIDYVLGKFALSTTKTELDPRWAGKFFEDLEPVLRGRFRNFGFVGRQLPASLDGVALREVFQRLNRTVEALEPQELRHAAYTSKFIQLVEMAAESAGLQELGVFSTRDVLRRRHDAFVSEVFYAYLLGDLPNKKDGLDDQYMIFERQGMSKEQVDDLTSRFGRANNFLAEYGARLKKTRFRNKSDSYTLLHILMAYGSSIPTSGQKGDALFAKLQEFSEVVNHIKRVETAGGSLDLQADPDLANASNYLRSVERAASDRQNRVRRNRALREVLSPLIANGVVVPFSAEDTEWLFSQPESDDEVDEFLESELDAVRRVLTDEGE